MGNVAVHSAVAAFSVVLTTAALILCIATLHQFKYNVKRSISTLSQERAAQRERRYFQITSYLSSICNLGCCASVSLYCVWIIFQPHQQFEWFITLRALPTVFWFVAKAALIWLYNGRLYFPFKKAIFHTSFRQFAFVNALIVMAVPLIVCGFLGVWSGKYWMISLGFEGYRFLFMLSTFYLLFAFRKKLSLLREYETTRQCRDATKITTEEADNETVKQAANDLMAEKEFSSFIKIASKDAALVLCISSSAVLVALGWIVFNYVFQEQNQLTLLLPMSMFAVDSVVDSVCIFITFIFVVPE